MKNAIKHLRVYSIILLFVYILVLVINKLFNSNFTSAAYLSTFINVFIYTTSIYLANTFFLGQFFNHITIKNANFKIALGYWVALISALFTSILVEFFVRVLVYNAKITEVFAIIYSAKLFPNYLLIFCVTTVVYFFLAYKSKQENRVREQKIVAQVASAKFESLKSQIDPHFLFNSLNVLSSLIEENTEKAQEFTIALSKTYRYVLEQRNKDLVPLSEEITFAKTFIKLLKLRFEDALEISLPNGLIDSEAKVVPLVLQLVLENAVKHNVINSQNKLIITIMLDDDVLIVKNNLQPKNILQNESTGFGLSHIAKQYQLVTNREVLIDKSDKYFTIYLPILTEQIITEIDSDIEFLTDELVLKRAKIRLKELKDFYTSIVIFVVFVAVYFVFELFDFKNPMKLWMPMAIGIYAFILIVQAVTIFGLKNWEQKIFNKLMNQYKKK